MSEHIDLDAILLTPAIVREYREFADRVAQAIVAARIDPVTIPDEQALLKDDGSITVFVRVSGKFEMEFSIPKDHWTWTRRQ